MNLVGSDRNRNEGLRALRAGLPIVVDLVECLGEERARAEGAIPIGWRQLIEAAQSCKSGFESFSVGLELILPHLDFIEESLDVSASGETEFRALVVCQLVRLGHDNDSCIEDFLQMIDPGPF